VHVDYVGGGDEVKEYVLAVDVECVCQERCEYNVNCRSDQGDDEVGQ